MQVREQMFFTFLINFCCISHFRIKILLNFLFHRAGKGSENPDLLQKKIIFYLRKNILQEFLLLWNYYLQMSKLRQKLLQSQSHTNIANISSLLCRWQRALGANLTLFQLKNFNSWRLAGQTLQLQTPTWALKGIF